MCGIYGSKKFRSFKELYQLNCARGNFAGGSIYLRAKDGMYIKKWKGVIPSSSFDEEESFASDFHTFLGHTQAPTGSVRAFKYNTSHPFEHGDWIVAHNGVLENDQSLREEIKSDSKLTFNTLDIPVDSAVIPALIHTLNTNDDVQAISDTLELLKGTFGCWFYNKQTQQTYLARSGSTLFANIDTGCFSSTMTAQTPKTLKQGKIYCLTTEGIATVGEFKFDSPFFTL